VPDDERTRIVWRVGDGPSLHGPASVVETCGRCSHPVYVDRVVTPDPPGCRVTLVCVPCGLADPLMRDAVLRMWKATRRLAMTLPAYSPRRRPGGRDG